MKTGDIPAGTWTVPINIPAIITYAESGQNMAANFNLNSDRIHISGTVNVVAGSCQTPDVYVHLGEYEITDMMRDLTGTHRGKNLIFSLSTAQ